jgi:heat shock protein HslJ
LRPLAGIVTASQTKKFQTVVSRSLLSGCENFAPVKREYALIGTKWILLELYGRPVIKSPKSKESPFILLGENYKASAYAGCNKLFAVYDLYDGFRIRFMRLASTRMACMDMKTEQILMEVLKSADTYSIKGNKMMLSKGKATILAKFVAE